MSFASFSVRLCLAFCLSAASFGTFVAAQTDTKTPKKKVVKKQEPTKPVAGKPGVHSDDEGGFQLRFENPVYSKRRIQPSAGNVIELHLFVSSSQDAGVVQSLSYHDLKANPSADQLSKVIQNSVDGFTDSIKGKLLSQTDMKVASFPGKQIAFQASNFGKDVKGFSRFIVRKNRIYQLTHVATADRFDEKRAKEFLSSLRFISIVKPKPRPVEEQQTASKKGAPKIEERKEKKDSEKGSGRKKISFRERLKQAELESGKSDRFDKKKARDGKDAKGGGGQ